MKWINQLFLVCLAACMSCSSTTSVDRSYNQGINIIPTPVSLQVELGRFMLNGNTCLYVSSDEGKNVAEFFARKLRQSTGFSLPLWILVIMIMLFRLS